MKSSLLLIALLGVLLFLSVTAALPSRAIANLSQASPLQVEVDVYSGRPNPRWNLSAQQTEEFLKMVRALPERERESALNQNLGYRGLKVKGSHLDKDGCKEIVIGNGIVVVQEENNSQQLTDKDRAVERWLLWTGKGKLETGLYDYLSQETLK